MLKRQAKIDMEFDSSIPKYISHVRKDATGEKYVFQSNEEHCMDVAKLAKQFASGFGMGNWGYVLGPTRYIPHRSARLHRGDGMVEVAGHVRPMGQRLPVNQASA